MAWAARCDALTVTNGPILRQVLGEPEQLQSSALNKRGWIHEFLASRSLTPQMDYAVILSAMALLAILLVIDMATGWNGNLVHMVGAIAVLAIGLTAFMGYRREANCPLGPAIRHNPEADQARDSKSADTAKNRYLANLSHEIRSPLNAIYGYAQLVERNEGVNPQDAARIIRRCAEHMTSLIDVLLDDSLSNNGVMRIKVEVISLGQFIDQIVSMMRPAASARGLAFEYVAQSRLPDFVRLDQNRFRQVLINLLTNAIKFTDHGSVTLNVRYAGQVATFEISDTGPGISPEDRERIFDPFERAGSDEQQTRPGMGMGLSITKAIVEILGGKLEIESVSGGGTLFRVSLMMGEVAGQAAPARQIRKVVGYAGKRRSIIIVDDDPEQMSFLEHLLAMLGFDVLAVKDGETLLSVSRTKNFDLAILDISLPGISGWETAAVLRARAGKDIQILMLSANAQEFHRQDFHTPLHDYFLVKPVKFDALIEAIGGLLNLSWKWVVAESVTEPSPPHSKSSLSPAARAHVTKLQELLRIGYVRGIEEEIRGLKQSTPAAEGLDKVLLDCLDRFDLARMSDVLERL